MDLPTYMLPLDLGETEEAFFIYIDSEAEDGFEYEVIDLSAVPDGEADGLSEVPTDVQIIDPSLEGIQDAMTAIEAFIGEDGIEKLHNRILQFIKSRDPEIAARYGLESDDAAA